MHMAPGRSQEAFHLDTVQQGLGFEASETDKARGLGDKGWQAPPRYGVARQPKPWGLDLVVGSFCLRHVLFKPANVYLLVGLRGQWDLDRWAPRLPASGEAQPCVLQLDQEGVLQNHILGSPLGRGG